MHNKKSVLFICQESRGSKKGPKSENSKEENIKYIIKDKYKLRINIRKLLATFEKLIKIKVNFFIIGVILPMEVPRLPFIPEISEVKRSRLLLVPFTADLKEAVLLVISVEDQLVPSGLHVEDLRVKVGLVE